MAKVIGQKKQAPSLGQLIRTRANYSLAILGAGFIHNGSGKFLNIRTAGDRLDLKRELDRSNAGKVQAE
ncbi:MAG: hypothetical protein ACKVQK_20795 [Burkholderiales bacterium]